MLRAQPESDLVRSALLYRELFLAGGRSAAAGVWLLWHADDSGGSSRINFKFASNLWGTSGRFEGIWMATVMATCP